MRTKNSYSAALYATLQNARIIQDKCTTARAPYDLHRETEKIEKAKAKKYQDTDEGKAAATAAKEAKQAMRRMSDALPFRQLNEDKLEELQTQLSCLKPG